MIPKNVHNNDEAKKRLIKLKKQKKILTDKNWFPEQLSIHMILETLKQQERLAKIFIKVKLLQKKLIMNNQIQQMTLEI